MDNQTILLGNIRKRLEKNSSLIEEIAAVFTNKLRCFTPQGFFKKQIFD